MKEKLRVRHYQAGYDLYTVRLSGDDAYGSQPFEIVEAWTPQGHYIGSSRDAYRLCKVRGIKPELASPDHHVCSIGFCKRDQKWYGWSHRAIFGFGIGDEVREGDCCASSGLTDEYIKEHPEEDKSLPVGFVAKTLEDCKRMAIAFAKSVS